LDTKLRRPIGNDLTPDSHKADGRIAVSSFISCITRSSRACFCHTYSAVCLLKRFLICMLLKYKRALKREFYQIKKLIISNWTSKDRAVRYTMSPPQHMCNGLASPAHTACRTCCEICKVIRYVAAPVWRGLKSSVVSCSLVRGSIAPDT